MPRRNILNAAILPLLVAGGPALLAQGSQTSGAARGVVMVKGGAAAAGARVVLANRETGFTRTMTTDARGAFQASLLPVGPYTVTVSAKGMRSFKDERVIVSLGESAVLNLVLEPETASAVVEVFASMQAVDVQQVNGVSTVDQKLVESIPLVSRNFQDLVRLTPGTVAGPGNPPRLMVEGARQIMNNLQIDGATNNSNFFGEQRGGAIIPFVFGADTIKELQVITNGYDVQYGNAAGAVVNAITKNGTNEFTGGTLYLVRNDSWQAKARPVPYDPNGTKNTQDALTRRGNSRNWNVNVGGPIIKDRLFYFVGIEAYKIDQQAKPAFGTSGASAADLAAFRASSLYNVVVGKSGATLGQEGGDPAAGTAGKSYTQSTDNTSYFTRLDFTLNEAHRFVLRVNYNKFKDTIGGGNSITATGESNQLLNTTNAVSWVLEANDVWRDDLISETRLQISNERRPFAGNGASPALAFQSFTAGTKTSTPRQMNEIMQELNHITTWIRGDLTLKGGFDFQKISIDNQFFNNGNGAFNFGSTGASYGVAARWAAGTLTAADTNLTYSGGTSFNGGRIHINTDLNSFFFQGQYQGFFSKRLTLMGGLRFNQQKISRNPLPNANLSGLDSAVNSSTVDPRLAFSFDLDGKGKTVIRGGYGYFSTPTPMLLVANTMTGNGNTLTNFSFKLGSANLATWNTGPLSAAALIAGSGMSRVSDSNLATLATTIPSFASSASGVQIWDPETKMARAKKASLGLEHDFGNGMTAGVKGTYTIFEHLQYLQNINLGQKDAAGNVVAGAIYNDGYPTGLNSFSTATRPGTAVVRGHTLNFGKIPGNPVAGFGDVYLVKGDGYGRYRGLSFSLNKRFNEDFGFISNVTFSKAEDTNSNERGTFTSTGGVLSELVLAATSNPANPFSDYGPAYADRFVTMNFATYFPTWFGVKGSLRFNYATGLPFTALAVQSTDPNGDGVKNDIAFSTRNGYRQPDRRSLDLRLSRMFVVYKKLAIEGSIDVFNVLNWANQEVSDSETQAITGTGTGATNTAFGKIGSRDFNTREVQFGIRFRF